MAGKDPDRALRDGTDPSGLAGTFPVSSIAEAWSVRPDGRRNCPKRGNAGTGGAPDAGPASRRHGGRRFRFRRVATLAGRHDSRGADTVARTGAAAACRFGKRLPYRNLAAPTRKPDTGGAPSCR